MIRVLLTRSGEGADALESVLKTRGFLVWRQPLLQLQAVDLRPEQERIVRSAQAVLLTSANAARFLSVAANLQRVPVFAVGEASARAARKYGWQNVMQAQGDRKSLIRTVCRHFSPRSGVLLHAAGHHLAGGPQELQKELQTHGFAVETVTMYRASPVGRLDPAVLRALTKHEIDAVTLFSARSARIFLRLTKRIRDCLKFCRVIAWGKSVRAEVQETHWKSMRMPKECRQKFLLQTLEDLQIPTFHVHAEHTSARSKESTP